LIVNNDWIRGSQLNLLQCAAVYFLILLQLMMYAVTSLAPGLFMTGLHFAINSSFSEQTYNDMALALYMILYVCFIYAHTQNENLKLVKWLFRLVVVINSVITPWLITMIVLQLVSGEWESIWKLDTSYNDVRTLMLCFVLISMLFPALLTALHGPSQLFWMAISFIQFYLFLPTMVGYFGAYASSRIWDLSWGNRPSDSLSSIAQTKTQAQQAENKSRIRTTARFVCWTIVALNLTLVLLLSELQSTEYALFIVTCIVFSAALLQMIVSFVFLLFRSVLVQLPRFLFALICLHPSFEGTLLSATGIKAFLKVFLQREGLSASAEAGNYGGVEILERIYEESFQNQQE